MRNDGTLSRVSRPRGDSPELRVSGAGVVLLVESTGSVLACSTSSETSAAGAGAAGGSGMMLDITSSGGAPFPSWPACPFRWSTTECRNSSSSKLGLALGDGAAVVAPLARGFEDMSIPASSSARKRVSSVVIDVRSSLIAPNTASVRSRIWSHTSCVISPTAARTSASARSSRCLASSMSSDVSRSTSVFAISWMAVRWVTSCSTTRWRRAE